MKSKIRPVIMAALSWRRERRQRKHHRWTAPEIQLAKTLPTAEAATKIGVSRAAVKAQRIRLGAMAMLLAMPMPMLAQTTITQNQMRFGAPGEVAKLRLFAVGLGDMVQVQIGPGLRLEAVEGGIRIVAIPLKRTRRALKQNAGGHYECPADCEIYRNGALMLEGWDYTHNGAGVIPAGPWAAEDTVVCATFAEVAAPP